MKLFWELQTQLSVYASEKPPVDFYQLSEIANLLVSYNCVVENMQEHPTFYKLMIHDEEVK